MTGRSPQVAVRRAKALELRIAGKSYAAIADELGYSGPGSASKDVCRALDQVVQEPGKQMVRLERERYDAMWDVAWEKARQGDMRALRECTRIAERRSRLLGLDKARTDVLADVRIQEGADGASMVGQLFASLRGGADSPDDN